MSRVYPEYEELKLRIEAGDEPGKLAIELLQSPASSRLPRVPFHPPFQSEEGVEVLRFLDCWMWKSGAAEAAPGRHLRTGEIAGAAGSWSQKQIGDALFQALFPGVIRDQLLGSLGLLHRHPEKGLRVRLVVDPLVAGEVLRWPWELIYRKETRDFMGRELSTPLVRQLEISRPFLSWEPSDDLSVLVVLADPRDQERLDLAAEKKLIEDALGSLDSLRLDFLLAPTAERLRGRLRESPRDVVHFIGHGTLDTNGIGYLLFETADGRSQKVSGELLADTLKLPSAPRLVLLNSCEAARMLRDDQGQDPFLGVASALLLGGVPAVIAHQFRISDRAAIAFSGAFYSALAAGDPLECAVTEGRHAIRSAQPGSWEWATPVLFLGTPHGHLFRFARRSVGISSAGGAALQVASSPDPAAELFDENSSAGNSAPRASLDSRQRALDLLERGLYPQAGKLLMRLLKTSQTEGDELAGARLRFFLILARLGGRRLRSQRLDVVRRVEADLEQASYLLDGEDPAHFWYLRALLRDDFYRYKGLKASPPSVDEALAEAREASLDGEQLQRLLNHLPMPPGRVREAVESHLEASA